MSFQSVYPEKYRSEFSKIDYIDAGSKNEFYSKTGSFKDFSTFLEDDESVQRR